jgi:regulatory protein
MNDKEPVKAALGKAMALCAGRELCISDIATKLTSWGITGKNIEIITATLVKEKFINEERFARAFANDKFRHNKWGRIKISYGLRMKKIPESIIKEAIAEIPDEKYLSVLRELIEAQKKKTSAKNSFDLKAKLARFALSRGFESYLVYDLLNESE